MNLLAVAIAGKFIGVYVGARLSRLSRWESVALGAGRNGPGGRESAVAMVGLRLGILSVGTYTIIVLVALVTSLMAPPILRLAMARIEPTAEEEIRAAEQRAWTGQSAGGVLSMDGLVSHRFPLDEINTAFATLREKPAGFVKAVVTFPDE